MKPNIFIRHFLVSAIIFSNTHHTVYFAFTSLTIIGQMNTKSLEAKMLKVFVYGTLKRGEPNHFWLLDPDNGTQAFIGEGQMKNPYPLVVATDYNIPFLLDSPGKGLNVKGEIYEIDEKMLSSLDELEDYPNLYTRRLVKISWDNTILDCWVYILPRFKSDMLEHKMLEHYSSRGHDNLPYLWHMKKFKGKHIHASRDNSFNEEDDSEPEEH